MELKNFYNKIIDSFSHPLYTNSIYLFLSSITNSALGLIFWIIATHIYPIDDVGIATALISAILLVGNFALLGFDIGIIRFLPVEESKERMVNTCITIIILCTVIFSLVFIFGTSIWMPDLSPIMSSPLFVCFFILFTIFNVVLLFLKNVFLSFRVARYSFIQYFVISFAKIIFVVILVMFGTLGIVSAYGIAAMIGIIISIFYFMPKLLSGYKLLPTWDMETVRKSFHFSFGNYIAQNLSSIPMLVFPILILSVLNPEMSAYFFMAWSIAQFFFTIPWSVGLSLFAEGSNRKENISSMTLKARKFSLLILIPIIVITLLFSNEILLIFGRMYSQNASVLLSILAISSIPVLFVEFFLSLERIRGNVNSIIFCYGFTSFATIGLGFSLISEYGINGIGIAWLISNLFLVLLIESYKRIRKDGTGHVITQD